MSQPHRAVTVTRTGGVVGMRLEATVDLDAVGAEEAARWRDLLADDALRQPPEQLRAVPDGFVYHVVYAAGDLDVWVGEQQLAVAHRALLARTVRPG